MTAAGLKALWADPGIPVTLRSTKTSPFGRKVRMALKGLELEGRVSVEPANPLDPHDTLHTQNPLGKMPCLLIGEEAFFDSHVILELLDRISGGKLVPEDDLARFRALTRAKLADGVLDAALMVTYEGRFREPEQASEVWLARQRGKIRSGLSVLQKDLPDPLRLDLVTITLASCLGYLDWRGAIPWRDEFPALAAWLASFAASQPVWQATESN